MYYYVLKILLLWLLPLLLFCVKRPTAEDYCIIRVPDLSPEAVVVSTTLEFIYPEPAETSIKIPSGESIVIACPGGTLQARDDSINVRVDSVEAKCKSGAQLEILGKPVNFNQIKCSREAVSTARYTGHNCELNGTEIEIGFLINNHHADFIRQFTICFDLFNYNPLYSKYNLTKSIGLYEKGIRRPSFLQDQFYDQLLGSTKLDSLYRRQTQKATINKLLGLPVESTKYIQNSTDYYLSRGHLTAKGDFVYAYQQRATFYYVNAAPQWQTFNGGNWYTAEIDVKNLAEALGSNLVVYTGTYGTATLPHEETGEETELYLYIHENVRKILVPELFWKIIYDPSSKKGVALLGVNNPYQKDIQRSVICEDVSRRIKWLNWETNNLVKGMTYVCDINELKRVVRHLPNLEVDGLLI